MLEEEAFALMIRQKSEKTDHLSGKQIRVIKDRLALEISKATKRLILYVNS